MTPALGWTRSRHGAATLVLGNWKMHGDPSMLPLLRELAASAQEKDAPTIGVAVPHTLISAASRAAAGLLIGAQDVHEAPSGAYTGGVSATMVRAAGAAFTIVGHSERRDRCGDTDASVAHKILRAQEADLNIVLCCGEPRHISEQGLAVDHVTMQLKDALGPATELTRVAIAYEPCWAIGTGHTPTSGDVGDLHAAIRQWLGDRYGEQGETVSIIYGGSVQPDSAIQLAGDPRIDGVLVGGSSLDVGAMAAIIRAFEGDGHRSS